MKTWIIRLCLVCICSVAWGEEELTLSVTESAYAYTLVENEFAEKSYGIFATDRDELVQAIRDFWGYPITIMIDDVGEMVLNSEKDIPMGTIYAKKGRWFVYYEQNKGYMDLWYKKTKEDM